MSPQKEVVIIGAGVIGCSIAYHLAQQGVPSQIIEMDSIAARASGKAWAVWSYPPRLLGVEGQPPDRLWSVPKGSVRPWFGLLWSGYHRLPNIAQELREKGGIDIGYGELPWIRVALSENDEKGHKALLSLIRSAGYYEGNWLEANDLKAIFPDINQRARGGLSLPYLQAEPYQYTLGLAQAAEKMGASIRQGQAVGFRHKGSRITSVILASGTEVEADVFVLAMGPWSGQGTSWLGKEIPILISRTQCLRVNVPQQLPPYALSIEAEGIAPAAIIPKVNGEVILGTSGIADLQPGFDSSVTEEIKLMILDAATGLLSGLQEGKLVEHRGDLNGWSPAPNHIQPLVGRLPKWENAYIATRMGALGVAMSLGVGEVMAALIISEGRVPDRVKTMMEVLSPARL